MQPTNKLRWVYKTRIIEEYQSGVKTAQQYKVLQQWWESDSTTYHKDQCIPFGEWRDIPIEVEE